MSAAQEIDPRAVPAPAGAVFGSYARLCRAILGDISGVCLLDARLVSLGEHGALRAAAAIRAARRLGWGGKEAGSREPTTLRQGLQYWLTLLPVETDEGALLGVFGVLQPSIRSSPPPQGFAGRLVRTLAPLIECLRRELPCAAPEGRESMRSVNERAAELEWLLDMTGNLRGSSDDRQVLEELLSAAAAHLGGCFGVLCVPEKHLYIEQACDASRAAEMRAAWERTRSHLLVWAQRQRRPLIVDGTRRAVPGVPSCKILSVPVARDNARVTGVLAVFNPPQAPGFRQQQIFLARHIGRQSAGFIDAQFDAMTGLYTREGLEHMYARLPEESGGGGSLLYVDVDGMRDVNELHGFEVGNELIVRVADVLAPPELPEQALAARLAGDKFAIALPDTDTDQAQTLAKRVQSVIEKLAIGPVEDPIEFSVSCGIAALVCMPQGLARALATAEVACKTAKKRGRGRVEVYSCEDRSMLRCQQDAVAVGKLRAALRTDRLLLYAQRIAPLRDPQRAGGYEILLRLLDSDGGIVLPSALIEAAQRYQLLPTVDRWVTRRALQMLSPYRSMLESSGLALSINLSGQSIGDEEFIRHLAEALQSSGLPPASVTFEITEQAAVKNLARAEQLIQQLAAWKCCFALDDFGTGSNSLTYLKALPIKRLKIDGSFVRDVLSNPRSEATVRGIVELARGMSLDTVAEYVESAPIAERMRELGVDYGQGFAFGKPQPLDAVLEDLSREESRRLHQLFLET